MSGGAGLLCALISCLCLGRVVMSGGAGLYSVP